MDAIVIYAGPNTCTRCLGWKRVANSEDGESWKYWAELPPPSNLAVMVGLVRPVECPRCHGTGVEPAQEERIGSPPADAKPAPKPLRAGDHVRHRPSGEEWVVAYQDGEHVGWCGWPAGEALAADCDLILAVTDMEHLAILRRLENGGDKRARMAREALAKLFGGRDR